MKALTICPSTLSRGFEGYSPKALKSLFHGKKTSPFLDFATDDSDDEYLIENAQNLSISGVQEKYSAIVENGKIRLAKASEQSTHILKPAPSERISLRKQIPANEHLTMQIARQVYGIETADNGLCFSADNQPVYITKRFDIGENGEKLRQEDFCSIIGRSELIDGANFKYDGSYEDIAIVIKKHVPAWPIAMEKFFKLLIFNYIFANGDAHLKNFSLLYRNNEANLAPAYDLINTSIHVNDADLALTGGLSTKLEKSDSFLKTGHPCQVDFRRFGEVIGLREVRINKIISQFSQFPSEVDRLISDSFLNDDSTKRKYWKIIEERRLRFIRND